MQKRHGLGTLMAMNDRGLHDLRFFYARYNINY